MCPNLINLDLGSNHLNNKYLDKLAETLSQCYNLANLKLSCIHNLCEDEEDDDDKILHFENVISQCPNLIKLELSSNNIEYKEINKIAKLLSKSTTLFHLDLSGNNIGDEEAKEIKKILSQCQTLKELLL
jgi:Ran GTPase-activating protein (RanGAP) involved in mRNA processing and transport